MSEPCAHTIPRFLQLHPCPRVEQLSHEHPRACCRFFQRSNGSLQPYDEMLACRLEMAFFGDGHSTHEPAAGSGARGRGDAVDMEEEGLTWDTKYNTAVDLGETDTSRGRRVVCVRKGGGFCQVRHEGGSTPHTARLVVRGYREQLKASESPPHEPYCGWDNWSLGGEEGETTRQRSNGVAMAAMVGRQRTAQASLDQMSALGLQPALGGAENGDRNFLLKRETDDQLERIRQTRERTAAAMQLAQTDASASMHALRIGLDHITQEAIDRFAAAGESLPAGLTPVGKPTMQLVGKVVGFTSVIGSWIVGGAEKVVDAALGASEVVADSTLRGGEAALSGVQTVMSAAQTEFVLGVEGAAIMENLINIHEAELKYAYSDIGYQQLARGISAYSALQQLTRPQYVHAGVVDACGPGMPGDSRTIDVNRATLALWLRYMRLSSCAYGVAFMAATGVADAKWVWICRERILACAHASSRADAHVRACRCCWGRSAACMNAQAFRRAKSSTRAGSRRAMPRLLGCWCKMIRPAR